MNLASLFQAVSLTPPEKPSEFLPWVLSVALGVILFLFWTREKERREENVSLRNDKTAIKTEYETKLAAANETIKTLGDKLDAMRTQLEQERIAIASLVPLVRRNAEEPEAWESELPSQVKHLAQIAPTFESRRALDEKLRSYVDSSEPPIPKPAPLPQIRPRQKSRPDRDR